MATAEYTQEQNTLNAHTAKIDLKKIIFGKTKRNTQAEIILDATIVSPELDVAKDTLFWHYHCKFGFVCLKCGAGRPQVRKYTT